MDYKNMTVDQLNDVLEDLDQRRLDIKAEGQKVMALRAQKMEAEHAARYGLTAEQYRQAKAQKPPDVGLAEHLGRARAGLQVAKATPGQVGVKKK